MWRENINSLARFKFLPVDYIVLVYNIVLALSLIFSHERVACWGWHLAFNLSIITLVLYLATTPQNPASGLMKMVRRWYFLILLLFIYEQTGGLVFLYFPNWLDNQLAHLEYSVFGVHPTLFLQRFNIPILNEYFMFGYMAYFFLILSYSLVLMGRKMHDAMDNFTTTAALTFLICFYMFNFFPIAGPRFLFEGIYTSGLKGSVFVPAVNYVIQHGAAEGGSMPSSHTAAALVILVHAWRYVRPVGYIFAPVVLGLVIGTFWGRFHFVSDTIIGFAIAVVCIIVVDWLVGKGIFKEKQDSISHMEKELVK